jgi:predicted signal transduction protein with EAL and GGDEF domain/DNA-binding response OmpR family regulator
MEQDQQVKRPSILVVDDDFSMRMLVRESLEGAGFDVEEAVDGRAGIAAFERLRPDLVLLDVMMPEMDGFAACATLRKSPLGEHTPILMMTGLDDEESINRAYDVGASDFIAKPINYASLAHRVRYMLRARETLEALRASQRRLADAQRIARLGHWELDAETDALKLSNELRAMLGLNSATSNPSFEQLLESIHPGDKKTFVATIKNAIAGRAPFSLEHRILGPDNSVRVLHQEGEVKVGEFDGRVRLLATAQDVTERKKAERKIFRLAYYDDLTRLPNRTFFKEHLRRLLAQAKRHCRRLAVVSLDLDHFKRINDTLGHGAGDSLLQEVATRLQSSVRQGDFLTRKTEDGEDSVSAVQRNDALARLDGDEFSLALSDIRGAEGATAVARRVIQSFGEPFQLNQEHVFITASLGITVYPDDGEDSDVLIKNAEAAMHHAKEHGRDNYQVYRGSINAEAAERLSLENGLRHALEGGEFRLVFQPKVETLTGRTLGAEALLRWKHPTLGDVSPAKFIPVAEESGLILPIGEWVLRAACTQAKSWLGTDVGPLRVAVNVSARQFMDGRLTHTITRILEEVGLPPKYLELELTEGVLMDDTEISARVLAEVKGLGLHIALDDFGTGYSSLSYLKRFPIDTLKIDRSFVRDITTDPDSADIAAAVIALTKSLRLNVVAEGVETQAELDFMRAHGCQEIQGYYFSPPLPARELEAFIRARRAQDCHLQRA